MYLLDRGNCKISSLILKQFVQSIKKFYPTYFSTVVYSVNYLVDFLRVYFTLHASNTKLTVQF